MRNEQTLLMALFYAVPILVQAQVDITITGSTAVRAEAYYAIRSMYELNLVSQNPLHDASGQKQVTFSGTIPSLFGGQTVAVRTSYSACDSGIHALTANLLVPFLSSATPGVATTVSLSCDFAFSEVFQGVSSYTSPALQDN